MPFLLLLKPLFSWFTGIFSWLFKNPMVLLGIALFYVLGFFYWDVSHLKNTISAQTTTLAQNAQQISNLNQRVAEEAQLRAQILALETEKAKIAQDFADLQARGPQIITQIKHEYSGAVLKQIDVAQGDAAAEAQINLIIQNRLACIEGVTQNPKVVCPTDQEKK